MSPILRGTGALLLCLPLAGAAAPAPSTVRLTVAEAVDMARRSSPRLGQLEALAAASAAALRAARAERAPLADLGAGYRRTSNIFEFVIDTPAGPLTIFPNLPDNYRSRLGLSVPLYTGGRIASSIAAAGQENAAAARDLEAADRDVVLETRVAYWSLVTALEAERVLREALRSYDAHIREARDREELGLAARNDVLAVQVERDRAELARLEAASGAEAATAGLVRLLGLPPGSRIEPAEPLEAAVGPPGELEELVARALAARPERAAIEARLAAAEARTEARRAGDRPQVGLAAAYDYANPNRTTLPPRGEWDGSWEVGVSLSFTLFDGGRTSAAVERDSALAEAVRRQLEELERGIRLEVTQRHLDLGTARATLEVTTGSLRAAEENRRVSQDRYREGLVPSSELLDAETALLRAGLDRTASLARLQVAAAGLARAVGT